jgi:hypothetical protein
MEKDALLARMKTIEKKIKSTTEAIDGGLGGAASACRISLMISEIEVLLEDVHAGLIDRVVES